METGRVGALTAPVPESNARRESHALPRTSDADDIGLMPPIRRPMTPEARDRVIRALARLVAAHLEREATRQGSLSPSRGTVGEDPSEEAQLS